MRYTSVDAEVKRFENKKELYLKGMKDILKDLDLHWTDSYLDQFPTNYPPFPDGTGSDARNFYLLLGKYNFANEWTKSMKLL